MRRLEFKKLIKECLVEEGLFGKKKKKEAIKEFDIDKTFSELKNKFIEVDGIPKAGKDGKNNYTLAGIPKREIPKTLSGAIKLTKLDGNHVKGIFKDGSDKDIELIAYQGLLEQL
jgi:hypothetical protein